MNNSDDKKIEKILLAALELLDQGKQVPDILNSFPEHKKELEEIFGIVKTLASEGNKMVPSKELLAATLSQLQQQEFTTKKELIPHGDAKKRSLFSLMQLKLNSFMPTRKQLIHTALLIVLVATSANNFLQLKNTEKVLAALTPDRLIIVPLLSNFSSTRQGSLFLYQIYKEVSHAVLPAGQPPYTWKTDSTDIVRLEPTPQGFAVNVIPLSVGKTQLRVTDVTGLEGELTIVVSGDDGEQQGEPEPEQGEPEPIELEKKLPQEEKESL